MFSDYKNEERERFNEKKHEYIYIYYKQDAYWLDLEESQKRSAFYIEKQILTDNGTGL